VYKLQLCHTGASGQSPSQHTCLSRWHCDVTELKRTLHIQVLGGKGGGKPAQAQCQGPNVDSIEDALQAAIEFAALKLE